MPNSLIRSKLKNASYLAAFIQKVKDIYSRGKKNVFNVETIEGQRLFGIDMTALDLDGDPSKITFTHNAVDYEFLLSDIQAIFKMRSRKWLFKVKVLTVIP